MANKKIGLDYFSHPTQYKKELKYLFSKFKYEGHYGYFCLMQKIYGECGYFMDVSEKYLYIFSGEISLPFETLCNIIELSLSENIFNKELYLKHKILSSKEIQEHYLDVCKKSRWKNISLYKELLLLDSSYIKDSKLEINYENFIFSE